MTGRQRIKENVQLTGLEDSEQEEKQKPFSLFEQTTVSKLISFYLNGTIDDPFECAEMVHRIRSATENDIIEIHLNTDGGSLDAGVQIINAMKSTPAHVITILDSKAFSLGTLLFLSGDELQVHDHCRMMFHNFSSGTFGKGNEQQAEINAIIPWYNKLIKKICYPFLTTEEIQAIVKGEDLWMDSDQIRKRLVKMYTTPKPPTKQKKDVPIKVEPENTEKKQE